MLVKMIRYTVRFITVIPHLLCLASSSKRKLLFSDVDRRVLDFEDVSIDSYFQRMGFIVKCLDTQKEFRNQFYYRIDTAKLFRFLCPPYDSLFINTKDIGEGLFVVHGYACAISAAKIGKNCKVHQHVTIGYSRKGVPPPSIGDNVTISAGSVIVGNITIGNNVTIGPNCVVWESVPDETTIVAAKSVVLPRKGTKSLSLPG